MFKFEIPSEPFVTCSRDISSTSSLNVPTPCSKPHCRKASRVARFLKIPLGTKHHRTGPYHSGSLRRIRPTRNRRRHLGRHLRHSIATYLIGHGTPLSVVSELLGHSDVAITMRYVKRDRHTVARFLSDKVSMTEQKGNETLKISLHQDALTGEKAHLKAIND